MSYSEAAYFDGNACAHCAARDENARLVNLRKCAARHIEREKRARPRPRHNV